MRNARLICALAGFVIWLGSAIPAAAQGVVAMPQAMVPAGAPGCQCGTPGCQCQSGANVYSPGNVYAPGNMYSPVIGDPSMTTGVTTWDPYTQPQTGMFPAMMGSQPTMFQGQCAPPCAPPRTLRFGVFAEYLYWRAGDSTTTDFAVPINGGIVPPDEPVIPVGPIATLNPDFDHGYRAGLWWQRTCETQIGASYTHFDTETQNSVAIDPADNVVLLALVVHPATVAADFFYTDAAAQYDVEYKTFDIDYRHVFCSDCVYRVNYIVGVRYLEYEDNFRATFTSPTRIETVTARNDFDGFGLRGGIEGEWGGQQGGLFGYGKFIGGAVAGELSSTFVQESNFDGVVVTTSRVDDRIIPTIEVEVGVGWRSRNQRWRLSGGYNITALVDIASANSLIHSIQTARYRDNEDTFTLDGLVARLEFAF